MKPNIICIVADDMGYGDLGCYGARKIPTPNMDKIANEGVRFVDMHSSAAVCTPSRYSVLTGRYAWRTWLHDFVLSGLGVPLIEPERQTVASMLRGCGYTTAAVGKWHLGLTWYTESGDPLPTDPKGWDADAFDVDYTKGFSDGPCDRGFDYFYGISASLDMPPYCYLENDHTVGHPSVEKDPYEAQQRRGPMVVDWADSDVDVTFTRKAVDFIDQHAGATNDQPFFLYITPSSPHRPCVPPEFLHGISEAGLRGDMVATIDWMVGQLRESLQSNGVAENTLILVTSDHGARLTNFDGKDYGHKSNGDLRGGKGDIWEGGHRVPCVAAWPGRIPAGTVAHEPLCMTDFMATCAEIVGETLSDDVAEDSRSFLPVLLGNESATGIHEAIVHHSKDGMFAIRSGPWKLILGRGSGGFSEPPFCNPGEGEPTGQLYNLEDDSRENLNLWSDRPDIVENLTTLLRRYREEGRSR